jgi:hypothetical protein
MDIGCGGNPVHYYSEDWKSKSLQLDAFNEYISKKNAVRPTIELESANIWNETCNSGSPASFHIETPSVILTDNDELEIVLEKQYK